MPTRLVNVVLDVPDPRAAAGFWAQLLPGWRTRTGDGEVDLVPPAGDGCPFELVFVPVTEPKSAKNRVHLDLASADLAEQDRLVRTALAAGAGRPDIGQGDATLPWVVLADPAGNEFCVLEPRAEYAATGALAAVVLAAADPVALAPFWAAATGTAVVRESPELVSLRAPDELGPWLELLRGNDSRTGKNRVHLDVAPSADGDLDTEVARLTGLGARPADVGQGAVPWTVLTDPVGNEFCVLRGEVDRRSATNDPGRGE